MEDILHYANYLSINMPQISGVVKKREKNNALSLCERVANVSPLHITEITKYAMQIHIGRIYMLQLTKTHSDTFILEFQGLKYELQNALETSINFYAPFSIYHYNQKFYFP